MNHSETEKSEKAKEVVTVHDADVDLLNGLGYKSEFKREFSVSEAK